MDPNLTLVPPMRAVSTAPRDSFAPPHAPHAPHAPDFAAHDAPCSADSCKVDTPTEAQGPECAFTIPPQASELSLPEFFAEATNDAKELSIDAAQAGRDKYEALAKVLHKQKGAQALAHQCAIASLVLAREIGERIPSDLRSRHNRSSRHLEELAWVRLFPDDERDRYRCIADVDSDDFRDFLTGKRMPTFCGAVKLGRKARKARKATFVAGKPAKGARKLSRQAWPDVLSEFEPLAPVHGGANPDDVEDHAGALEHLVGEAHKAVEAALLAARSALATKNVAELLEPASFLIEKAHGVAFEHMDGVV